MLQEIYDSSLATSIREVDVLFPALESLHVIAVTLVVGTIAVVDLRLLGIASHRRSASRLIHELLPFTWGAFAVALVTGSLMFTSKSIDYAANTAFLWKLVMLFLAGLNMTIFHLGAHRRIASWDSAPSPPSAARMAGLVSLILWTATIVLGRWIGFL